jgi:hypothetical protein
VTGGELREWLRLLVDRRCGEIAEPLRQRAKDIDADFGKREALLSGPHCLARLDAVRSEAEAFANRVFADLEEHIQHWDGSPTEFVQLASDVPQEIGFARAGTGNGVIGEAERQRGSSGVVRALRGALGQTTASLQSRAGARLLELRRREELRRSSLPRKGRAAH